eukprot:5422599-Pyramimonas_sp.AAC.2
MIRPVQLVGALALMAAQVGGGVAAAAMADRMRLARDVTVTSPQLPSSSQSSSDVTELTSACVEALFTFAIAAVWLNVTAQHNTGRADKVRARGVVVDPLYGPGLPFGDVAPARAGGFPGSAGGFPTLMLSYAFVLPCLRIIRRSYALLRIRFALRTHNPPVLRTLAPVVPKTSSNTAQGSLQVYSDPRKVSRPNKRGPAMSTSGVE